MVYYSQGGIGRYTLWLVQELAAVLRNAGDEVYILQSRKDHRLIVSHERFRRASLWTPCHHWAEQITLPMEIWRLRLDVLHSPDFIPPFRRNCHSVITIHDLAFLLYPQFMTPDSARYYSQIDQAVRNTDHIIAVSESTRRDLIRLLGVPEEKTSVIYEAANPLFQPIDKELARRHVAERHGVQGDYILFVSTIEPRKNVPTLLRAYRQFLDDYKVPVKLVLAGAWGWLYDDVIALVKELHLEEECVFLGRVSTSDLLYLYNGARLLVQPSYYEGFGLVPLEAMACGVPTVVSNVSSLPEVVGDAAILVEPDNIADITAAMWTAHSDEARRADMIAKGFKRAACFSWRRTAEETLAVYRKVVQG